MTSQIPHAPPNHLSDPKLPLKGVTPDADYSWEASLSTQVYGINVRLLVRCDVAGETRRDREGSTATAHTDLFLRVLRRVCALSLRRTDSLAFY